MTPNNIVILRPGALGDVLVCRHLLGGLKAAFPFSRRVFVAPGERGKLFGRFGLADVTADWENAAFAWLFSADAHDAENTPSPPPALLRELFTPGTLALAYLDLGEEEARRFRNRLSAFSADSASAPPRLFLSPSRPQDGSNTYIGEWLLRNALEHCGMQPGAMAASEAAQAVNAELPVDAEPDGATLAIHPGSGSAKKNWPLPCFAALAERLTAEDAGTGLKRIRILAGEADGGLGGGLAAMLPATEVTVHPPLDELASILASAALYLGNDSGVTHLAAAVRARSGKKPNVTAVFGPSDPDIWAAPGTLALRVGKGMDGLSVESAFSLIRQTFFPADA